MKKIKVVVAILVILAIGAAFFVPKYLRNLHANQAYLEQLTLRIKSGFDNYIRATNNATLYACTGNFASFKSIPLTPDFYSQAKQYAAEVVTTGNALKKILTDGKSDPLINRKAAKSMDDTLKEIFSGDDKPVAADNVTRGYCRNFAKGFSEKIDNNIARYRANPPEKIEVLQQQNAIYLNTKLQVTNITANIDNQTIPTTLFINSQAYPIQCRYQDGQPFVQAIASKKPQATLAYKASDYFYQHYSPQINTVLTCQADVNLNTEPQMQFNDTYPWYQPTVTGNLDDEPAAGDALTYLEGNQLIIVLGHEPCVCNGQTAQQCAKVKTVSRSYNNVAWPLITSLQAEAPKHSAKAQEYMNNYFAYAKNQLRHDFCYIDRTGMMVQLDVMFKGVMKSEKPLYKPKN